MEKGRAVLHVTSIFEAEDYTMDTPLGDIKALGCFRPYLVVVDFVVKSGSAEINVATGASSFGGTVTALGQNEQRR